MSLGRFHCRILLLFAAFFLAGISVGYSNPLSGGVMNEMPVNFTAKTLAHDDVHQTVTALGDVELVQDQRILRADKIVYSLAEDKVAAIGNVSLLDEAGNVHFAEYVELQNKMKDGFVQGLLTLLADGSRFTAAEGKREEGGTRTTMTDASYTMCKVCEIDPHPLWQIKADQVVHDSVAQDIKYKNARLELMGVPVAWTPIFSHPDPTLKRKSGFLRPQYGWAKELGAHLTMGYYYTITPDNDVTLEVEPTALAGTLVEGEWRKRFENGRLQINAGTVNSDRKEEDGRVELNRQRGHVFAEGRYDINDKWRGGLNIARASDKEYLRLYDISKENVLSSQLYAERFSGRDYSRISAMNFQDVRLGILPEQPDILPMAEHAMTGEPGALLGGRWDMNVSALGLTRNHDGQDVQRGSVSGGWEMRRVTAAGFSHTVRLEGRGDVYNVQNSDAAVIDPTLDPDPTLMRGMATASLVSGYPLVKRLTSAQAVIEPMVSAHISPRITDRNNEIPNEDSVDMQFDVNNLFQPNRFPGIDREEDGGRAAYGVKAGIYGDDGRYGHVFLGQSHRFYGDGGFPAGSGFEDRNSDIVGQIRIGLADNLDGDYRFQFDNETWASERHEVQAGGGNDVFRLNTRYLYIGPMPSAGFTESRQQVGLDGVYSINENWSWRAAGLYDLGGEPGLRNAMTGIEYADECFMFGIQGIRNVAEAASGDDETKILLRIGLKSIGEFSAPQIQLGRASSKTDK